jgi:hypothetical protein
MGTVGFIARYQQRIDMVDVERIFWTNLEDISDDGIERLVSDILITVNTGESQK